MTRRIACCHGQCGVHGGCEVSRLEIHEVDLIEGIAGLTLALEHEPRGVAAEVSLARAPSLEAELAHAGQQGAVVAAANDR